MIVKEYTDDRGIQRRVTVQNQHDDPAEGIPLDVFDKLDELYQDTPSSFRRTLYKKLWARGLITSDDFNRPTAQQTFRRALTAAIASDAQNAIQHITE